MIESDKVNLPTIECIMVILCLCIKDKAANISSLLMSLLKSDYAKWAVDFLLDIVSNPCLLNIKVLTDDTSKKSNEAYKCSYKIIPSSMSIRVSKYFKILPNVKFIATNKIIELIDQSREKFVSNGIFIVEVTFSFSYRNCIRFR